MGGDVASAFRNIRIHSNSVLLFADQIEEENGILSAPFGWTGSPGFYESVGGVISHVHDSQYDAVNPAGIFNYHWVDDHINVTASIGTSLEDMNRSLRFAMAAIMCAEAINGKKCMPWKTHQRVFRLEFDSVAESVSMCPRSARLEIVASAYFARSLTRKNYRSLVGAYGTLSPTFALLGLSSNGYGNLHRFQIISVTKDMKQILLWWWLVLIIPNLTKSHWMNASDFGLCALYIPERFALTYQFLSAENELISDFKSGSVNGFEIRFSQALIARVCCQRIGPMLIFKTLSRPPSCSRSLSNRQHTRHCVTKQALIA
ncbi:LOW QUALITY PROTEIN: hypothetical protein PHMEG_00013690 [Phytophthora megakarya]|uniref:Uncharacterized protein n=1 Tax=Phytophthora megakarya TaxID=4795 RepID=A0A225W6R3_9STRA|nr:LOW QUALITY PROTEIN: hypothetical protein PHMEG_00013690 [Phytophthora megakarya]